MARLQRFPRPEGGAEREVLWETRHGCAQGAALRDLAEVGANDTIMFPVGLAGEGVPGGTPFQVIAADDCGACGARLAMWAEWAPKLYVA